MRVVTDGDDGLRNFVQRSSPRPMESQLDWFHIGMKLELLRKAVGMPVTYQEYLDDPNAFDPPRRRISRLRDALWRGRAWQARLQFAWLRERSTDGRTSTLADAFKQFGAPSKSSKSFGSMCAETAEVSRISRNSERRTSHLNCARRIRDE